MNDKMQQFLKGVGMTVGGALAIGIIILLLFCATFVTFVDKHEFGFVHNRFSGAVEVLDRTGFIVRWPIKYKTHHVDCRPYQLSITASFGDDSKSDIPSRVLNAKLVKFNPAGLKDFITWHGVNAGDDLKNLKEIMKCYAFDKYGGKNCPFITVLSEINPSQTPEQTGNEIK
jgi:hypothetical protein